MSIFLWLNKPYPLITSNRAKLVLVVSFGLFVALFLNVFQPFGASEITTNKVVYLSGFGLAVSLALTVSYFVIPAVLLKVFSPDKWQIKKEIGFIIFSFLLVATFNFLYNKTIGSSFAPERTYLQFIGITISIGLFPTIILVFLVELMMNRKNDLTARNLTQQIQRKTDHSEDMVVLVPQTVRSEPVSVPLEDFLYAESDNNYSTVYFIENGELRKSLLRLSLKNLEDQLSSFDELIRCHKKFLVNKTRIKEIMGNARSLNLQLDGCDTLVPVSRNLPKEALI